MKQVCKMTLNLTSVIKTSEFKHLIEKGELHFDWDDFIFKHFAKFGNLLSIYTTEDYMTENNSVEKVCKFSGSIDFDKDMLDTLVNELNTFTKYFKTNWKGECLIDGENFNLQLLNSK